MKDWLEQVWYRPEPPPAWLRPLGLAYGAVATRLAASRRRQSQRLPVPVIVVGNVAVGGTGKTPCVLWLVETLRGLGYRPGILSRGYGGRGPFPFMVAPGADPALCGDEPALMAERGGVPLAVAPDRLAAGRLLLQRYPQTDVLVCDDGLQHYRLQRDLEFCVVDGRRGYGNGWQLPAGPLREPPSRAGQAALILVNGGDASAFGPTAVGFSLVTASAVNLRSGERRPLRDFAATPVHAVAGIGNPGRYFDSLRVQGLQPVEHAFADHHAYTAADLDFGDARPLLMTEKDAVKCRAFAAGHWWAVPASLQFTGDGAARVTELLKAALRPAGRGSA
ncbi:tetraacyldisaccharide 4'-kinase [Solimonas sp. K1W22B-7]|uniref:tetraacyldisaccharide 4'-kinase n=1 Tax=Solimonas sp. K1W22B-7 TaxID=2303331 RepID=UPI000E3347E5|nr:tetraacyldisaccharide 4'-kinase [Solimonas sp. K1W22B-7]AXQ29125.1 tetraacyldisaccharide 4'-kinase [Solimonas sp. K1W22B-7]